MRVKGFKVLLIAICAVVVTTAASLGGYATGVANPDMGSGLVDPDTGSGVIPVTVTRDPTRFNVTVPTSFPVYVDGAGKVITSSDAKIVNNSYGDVYVSQVSIECKSDWSLTDWQNLSLKLDSKKFAMSFNLGGQSLKTTQEDTSEVLFVDSMGSKDIRIPGVLRENLEDNRSLKTIYDAVVAMQSKKISDLQIADVVFTVAWAEGD